jgi:hypothetical protein
MEQNKVNEKRIVHGRFVRMWWDGALISELKAFKAEIEISREDVQMAGALSMGSKVKSLKGVGTFKIAKVFSRGLVDLLTSYKAGLDPEALIVVNVADPDSYGKETITLSGVKFDKLTLVDSDATALMEQEWPFTFRVESVNAPDTIVSADSI